jgi:hypothetical protein
VIEVCPERIFWFLGFEISVKVFSGFEEDVILRGFRGNWYKNKECTDSDDNGKKSANIGQHLYLLMCIEVGRKNTFLGSISLLTIYCNPRSVTPGLPSQSSIHI